MGEPIKMCNGRTHMAMHIFSYRTVSGNRCGLFGLRASTTGADVLAGLDAVLLDGEPLHVVARVWAAAH